MTDAEKMKAVIERASQKTSDSTCSQRLENARQLMPSQRTPTMQPKHETPKQR